jgi:hypothetical protein
LTVRLGIFSGYVTEHWSLGHICLKISGMAKKTGFSDSSLWIITVVLIVLSAWMWFRH